MSYTPDNAQLLNAMQNVMVISTTDLQGNITYANDLFCTLTGFAREELIGQPHSIVRHPDGLLLTPGGAHLSRNDRCVVLDDF